MTLTTMHVPDRHEAIVKPAVTGVAFVAQDLGPLLATEHTHLLFHLVPVQHGASQVDE